MTINNILTLDGKSIFYFTWSEPQWILGWYAVSYSEVMRYTGSAKPRHRFGARGKLLSFDDRS
jgi:ABC-type proline/glycine betaine transport system substrate-binding protein